MLTRTLGTILLFPIIAAGCIHHPRPVRQFGNGNEIATAIAWSADGALMATGCTDGAVRIWQVDTGKQLARAGGFQRHTVPFTTSGMAFSPDADALVFGTYGGKVELWRWRKNSQVMLSGHVSALKNVIFSPDGRQLMSASGGLHFVLTFAGPESRPGTAYVTMSKLSVKPTRIIVYDVRSQKILSRLKLNGFLEITFSPYGRKFAGVRLATGNSTAPAVGQTRTGCLEVRNTSTGALIHRLPGTGLRTVFSPQGKFLINGTMVWNLRTWQPIRQISINAKCFTADGKKIIVVNQGYGVPWDILPDAETPWTRVSYVSTAIGTKRKTGWYIDDNPTAKGFGQALFSQYSYSPDRRFAVDRHLRLWRVPN